MYLFLNFYIGYFRLSLYVPPSVTTYFRGIIYHRQLSDAVTSVRELQNFLVEPCARLVSWVSHSAHKTMVLLYYAIK